MTYTIGSLLLTAFLLIIVFLVVRVEHVSGGIKVLARASHYLGDAGQIAAWKLHSLGVALADGAEAYERSYRSLSGTGQIAIDFERTSQ